MDTSTKEHLIHSYLHYYNTKNVTGMLDKLHDQIRFENYSDGKLTHQLTGKAAFRSQAEEALTYFSERMQIAEEIIHHQNETEIWISYSATAAMDFPNGLKKGQKLQLQGRSVFRFLDEKICEIRDYS